MILSRTSTVVATRNQSTAAIGERAVILGLTSGTYFGLNAVGTRIWALIQEPKQVGEIEQALLAEYEVEPDACGRDLLTLLQELASKGLIDVRDE